VDRERQFFFKHGKKRVGKSKWSGTTEHVPLATIGRCDGSAPRNIRRGSEANGLRLFIGCE
jgi:hypothetical protein